MMSFFVYGSLSEGMVHFSKIKDFVEGCRPATIRGTAYRTKVGYPVISDIGDDEIQGFLVDLRTTDLLVNLLDQFHGCRLSDEAKSFCHRKQLQVIHDAGETTAWAYVVNPAKKNLLMDVIVDGDWKKALFEKPTMVEKLTDKQRDYIQRLGASTGREIVPMKDLVLYRELMSLELIVDKGRRLALSNLGKEVYRYL